MAGEPAGRESTLDASTPAGAAATTAVGLAFLDRSRAAAEAFLASAYEEPRGGRRPRSMTSADLWLTLEETRKVTAALSAALEPYRGRVLADRPDGSRRVRVTNLVVPYRKR